MSDKSSKNSQFSKAAEILLALRPNIAAADRKAACDQLKLSRSTVGNYINGNVRDLATAERLIVFFREVVNRRELVLTGE
mgnify:CR=1 FL=1